MTTQELFLELRRHNFVPAPKLGTTGVWSLQPPRGSLKDPDKAKVEVVLLGPDRLAIGPPGQAVMQHQLTTPYQLSLLLLQHGAQLLPERTPGAPRPPYNETNPVYPDFFTLPEKTAPKAKAKATR